jgi:hypothetical protein
MNIYSKKNIARHKITYTGMTSRQYTSKQVKKGIDWNSTLLLD